MKLLMRKHFLLSSLITITDIFLCKNETASKNLSEVLIQRSIAFNAALIKCIFKCDEFTKNEFDCF